MSMSAWLQRFDLDRYAAVFARNAIDLDMLPAVSDDDLKRMGVLLGHRKKIIRAAAVLWRGAAGPRLGAAERRPLSVMFCDLVGSTALAARLDPEDLRDIVAAYQACVGRIVERHGGAVAQFLGDGALVYFGYPTAHEDDAERAVRAGLALIEAVGALDLPAAAALEVRIGVVSGLVVVGDLLGSTGAQDHGVIGETPTLAAKLQSLARPGALVIAQSTRRLIGKLFDYEDLGDVPLKDVPAPVRSWRVLRESVVDSRFEALRTSAEPAPMIGREAQVAAIIEHWAAARAGEGRVVTIAAEPGLGKSRLLAAVRRRIEHDPCITLTYDCSPHHVNSALHPFIVRMQRAARWAIDDTPRDKFRKLAQLLARIDTPPEDVALFGELLALPRHAAFPLAAMGPQVRKMRTMQAYLRQLVLLARRRPLLILIEDAHWLDPTSAELLAPVIARIETMPVLILMTTRAQIDSPWRERRYVHAMGLARLDRAASERLVRHVSGAHDLPCAALTEIVERGDGVPLFLEELTRAVMEAGPIDGAMTFEPRRRGAPDEPMLQVPPTLHASLLARLDRLGSAKEIAQIGAAIGREFPHELLVAVALRQPGFVEHAIERLIASGLVTVTGEPHRVSYLFRHALIQDAAYGTLLRGARLALHARIVEAIEAHCPDLAQTQPELMAHHCGQAGAAAKAVTYWAQAAEDSIGRLALTEALAHLARGLRVITRLAPSPETRRAHLRLEMAQASTLSHIHGIASPAVAAAFDRAERILVEARAHGDVLDSALEISVQFGLGNVRYLAIDGVLLRAQAEKLLALAQAQNTPAAHIIAHRLMGTSLFVSGEYASALVHFDRVGELYADAPHTELAACFQLDPGLVSQGYRAATLWRLGHPDTARAAAQRALEAARAGSHAPTTMSMLLILAVTFIDCGRTDEGAALMEELAALMETRGRLPLFGALAKLTMGRIHEREGRNAQAVSALRQGLADYAATSATVFIPEWRAILAVALARTGAHAEARSEMAAAFAAMERTAERFIEPELCLRAAQIDRLAPQSEDRIAETWLLRGIVVAQAQAAKSCELRCATALAAVRLEQARFDEAAAVLAPVRDWFTEGADTPDLARADDMLALIDRRRASAHPLRGGDGAGSHEARADHDPVAACGPLRLRRRPLAPPLRV